MAQSVTRHSSPCVDRDKTMCPICMEQFKSPKFLFCLHTFCRECIKQIEENRQIICPLCRSKTMCGSSGVDDLRHNFFIESLIRISNTEIPTCEACKQKVQSEHYCYDCKQHLCQACFIVHQGLSVSRTHRSTEVGCLEHRPMTMKSYCSRHRDEELRFNCKNCDMAICRDCKATNHDGHKTVDIEEYRKESEKRMVKAMNKIDGQTEQLESAKRFMGFLDEMNSDMSSVVNGDLAVLRKRMHESVDEECDNLQKSLKTNEKEQAKSFEKKKHAYSSVIHSLVWRRNHISSVLRLGTTADIVETNRLMKDLSSKTKTEANLLNLKIPSISKGTVRMNLSRTLHFSKMEVRIPLKYEKVSCFVLQDIYPLWISKLQVTERNDCYVSLQHAHKSTQCMPFSFNIVRYKENGDHVDFMKGSPVKDLEWANGKLYVLFEYYLETIPPVSHEESGQSNEQSKFKLNRFMNKSKRYVCVFRDSVNSILLLNTSGDVEDTDKKRLCNLSCRSIPASAVTSKNGDILVCFPDERCIIQYNAAGKEELRYNHNFFPLLPPSFQPRDIAVDDHGMAYVVDYDNNSVFGIDERNCHIEPIIYNSNEICNPLSLDVDKKGRLWVGHSKDKITIFSLS